MSMRITFELSDRDIQHFKRITKNAKALAKEADEQAIITAAEKLLADVEAVKTPDFISERLLSLRSLIEMLRDQEWGLGAPERERVRAALAYFLDPEDLIPDATPGFGFLDDAIMVELITRELKHEIEAYDDFCKFRERKAGGDTSRAGWLESKRKELYERMRRRTRRDRSESRIRVRLF